MSTESYFVKNAEKNVKLISVGVVSVFATADLCVIEVIFEYLLTT